MAARAEQLLAGKGWPPSLLRPAATEAMWFDGWESRLRLSILRLPVPGADTVERPAKPLMSRYSARCSSAYNEI